MKLLLGFRLQNASLTSLLTMDSSTCETHRSKIPRPAGWGKLKRRVQRRGSSNVVSNGDELAQALHGWAHFHGFAVAPWFSHAQTRHGTAIYADQFGWLNRGQCCYSAVWAPTSRWYLHVKHSRPKASVPEASPGTDHVRRRTSLKLHLKLFHLTNRCKIKA